MATVAAQPPQDIHMLVNQGQQARELQTFQVHPSLPAVAAGQPETEADAGQRMRWRVVCISAVLAVYLVINTLLQYIFDMAAMTEVLEKVREVSHMRGGPSAMSFFTNQLPSAFMGITIGLLVPLCGYLGVRHNQKWLMGCFCGCNAFHCCMGIISMVIIMFTALTIQAVTPQVELFLEKCDPMQCRPIVENGTDLHADRFVDCLATGEWKEYSPRLAYVLTDRTRLAPNAPWHFPADCPPIFLTCNTWPDYKVDALGQKGIDDLYREPLTEGFPAPVRTLPQRTQRMQRMQPRGAFNDADAPVRAAGMGDYGAFMSSEVPTSTRLASSSQLRGPHQGLRRLRFAFDQVHQKGKAKTFENHKPEFTPPSMPKDPIAECKLTENVARFHQIRLLAPQLLPQLEIFLLLRMVLLLPLVVLGCLGFCWGKDLFERLNAGYNPVARSQETRPQVMLNPALGITATPTAEFTQTQMAQPLMLSAPPVPSPQVTSISPPSFSQ